MPPDRASQWEERLRAATSKDSGTAKTSDLPFDDLAAIGFFKRDEANSPFPEEKKNQLRGLWRSPHLVPLNPRMAGLDPSVPPMPAINLKQDKIVVEVAADDDRARAREEQQRLWQRGLLLLLVLLVVEGLIGRAGWRRRAVEAG